MEDNTKPSSGVQPPAAQDRPLVDAADLLISDAAAWKERPPTKSALGCGSTRGLGMSVKNGELVRYPLPCHSYGHKACAEKAVVEHLRKISLNLGDDRSGYAVEIDSDRFESDLLRDRLYRYRLKHPGDEKAWYRFVKRDDGTVWIFGTVNLLGRLPPMKMEAAPDLLVVAGEALRLPGVLGFRGTPWRLRVDSGSESDLHSFGAMTDEERDAFLPAVAAEVKRRFGTDVEPSYPVAYGSGVTVEQYVECADAVRERG